MTRTATRTQYVRLNNNTSDWNDQDNNDGGRRSPAVQLELRSRGRSNDRLQQESGSSRPYRDDPQPVQLFCERTLTKTDTLQSLALTYRIPVADLKRYNNLMTDQDFYALSTVKIPVSRHSLLNDQLAGEASTSGQFVDNLIPLEGGPVDISQLTVRSVSLGSGDSSRDEMDLNNMDSETRKSLEKLLRAADKNIEFVTNRTEQLSHDVFNASTTPPSPEMHFYEASSPVSYGGNSRTATYMAMTALVIATFVIVYLIFAEGAIHESLHPHHKP